jgi:hypothetical protein
LGRRIQQLPALWHDFRTKPCTRTVEYCCKSNLQPCVVSKSEQLAARHNCSQYYAPAQLRQRLRHGEPTPLHVLFSVQSGLGPGLTTFFTAPSRKPCCTPSPPGTPIHFLPGYMRPGRNDRRHCPRDLLRHFTSDLFRQYTLGLQLVWRQEGRGHHRAEEEAANRQWTGPE